MTVTAIIAIVISMVIVIDESLTWPHTIVLENHTKPVSKSMMMVQMSRRR